MNIGYALPHAKTFEEICAIKGRISKTRKHLVRCGSLVFGGSKHVASIILSAMAIDSEIRSAIDIRYSEEVIQTGKKIGLKSGSFDRAKEPKETTSTMEWGTKKTIQDLGFVPDMIYDKGSIGKEPMIRVLGKNPNEVVLKVYKIVKSVKK
jgi:hydroxymethylpyrimidine/phosphomethylpyrimidine kinase